jgi:hypothetical protein
LSAFFVELGGPVMVASTMGRRRRHRQFLHSVVVASTDRFGDANWKPSPNDALPVPPPYKLALRD